MADWIEIQTAPHDTIPLYETRINWKKKKRKTWIAVDFYCNNDEKEKTKSKNTE